MQFSTSIHPYALGRFPIMAKQGMVATSQHLAAQAGLRVLERGGNAIDAAVATAAALTVVEPVSNGLGGDAFALVWTKGKLHGLNASGRSPRAIDPQALRDQGHSEMPRIGWAPVTVPGIPAAWASLVERFGSLPLSELLESAISYAEEGFAVTANVARTWQRAFKRYEKLACDPLFTPWFETFAPLGRAPREGELFASPAHAKTLRAIGASGARDFYTGKIASHIDAFSRSHGGHLRIDDLASHVSEWVQPISVGYRGYDVWEIPPNGQGIAALSALNILNGFDPADRFDERSYHRAIEAIKMAMSDAAAYVAEPNSMSVSTQDLLSQSYAALRRSLITEQALEPACGKPMQGGTVYLATADDQGNMVSFIQSNYEGFGSAVVIPGTGIALQNRGANFSLDLSHPNRLEPGKRPYHTIIPAFLTKDNHAVGPFGVMGGFNQPQGHVQVVLNTIDGLLDPQAALDAPRWRWLAGKQVLVEHHFPLHIAKALAERGHEIKVSMEPEMFGRGQIIWRNHESGLLIGGTESRTDGAVVAW